MTLILNPTPDPYPEPVSLAGSALSFTDSSENDYRLFFSDAEGAVALLITPLRRGGYFREYYMSIQLGSIGFDSNAPSPPPPPFQPPVGKHASALQASKAPNGGLPVGTHAGGYLGVHNNPSILAGWGVLSQVEREQVSPQTECFTYVVEHTIACAR